MVGDALYFDIQGGGLFWSDFANHSESSGNDWPRPSPSGEDVMTSTAPGLPQRLSENEVTYLLWALSNGAADPGPVLQAWASPRMKEAVQSGGSEGFERTRMDEVTQPTTYYPYPSDRPLCR
jgi:hypothetical protein